MDGKRQKPRTASEPGAAQAKSRRQDKIRELVEAYDIETQEDLATRLREAEFEVTQATVSRDVKEMRLVKMPMEGGRSRYALPREGKSGGESRLAGLLRDAATGVDTTGGFVVLRTLPGMANAVASALDTASWPEIIGTVAGDDTIFAAVKPEKEASVVAERLRGMMG